MHALKKLKKLIIVKILLPILLIMVCIATLVMVVYEIFEKVDQLATAVANVVEKVDNFVNGLGFQNSEEAFYEELDELQKQYNNALDVPLLMSTLFYDDIQNNMDASSGQTDAISDGESMLSFATVFGWVKDKIKESQVTVGKDGYEYSSNKIYRLRMLAKKMVTKTGTNSKPWDEYLEMCADRIGKTIKNFFSLENITDILLDFLTFGTWRIPTFAVSMAQMLDGSQVFETTNFYNMLTDNAFTDLLDIFAAVFETVSDITGIEACLDGLVCIKYATYEKNDSEYYTYLKNYYIPRMPEFRKYIQVTDAANSEELIDKVIKEIKEIYNNYEEFFGIRRGEEEEYNATCVGNIKEDIVTNVRKPVDYTQSAVFTGTYAFGVYNRQKHNGLDINSNTTGNKEGDSVFSITDNGVVMESTVDGTYKCENCKGGWVKISYSNTYNNKLYKFSIIYGGLSVESLKLKKGDSVKKDDEIGKIGNASESENGIPSLHFGFYDDDNKVFLDPTNIFNICSKSVRGNSMAEKMWWALLDAGFSKEAAAGVIGNAAAETGGGDIDHIITFSLENGESYETVIARGDRGLGLLGWTYKDFKDGLLGYAEFIGGNWYDEEVQLGYMVHSIKGDNSGAVWDKRVWYISKENQRLGQTYEAFTGASTPEEAATIFCSFYERPAAGCLKHRETAARTAYDRFKDLQDPGKNSTSSAPVELNGSLVWPLPSVSIGKNSSRFGYRINPVTGRPEYHHGEDIGAEYGSTIVSASNGKVCGVGSTSARGYYILVFDESTSTKYVYQHMSQPALKSIGTYVSAGEQIGTVGSTGLSTGPHLHFEIHTNDTCSDSIPWRDGAIAPNTMDPMKYNYISSPTKQ